MSSEIIYNASIFKRLILWDFCCTATATFAYLTIKLRTFQLNRFPDPKLRNPGFL